MRGGILTIGIILLIFGILLYFTGNNMVNEVEAYDVYDIPISEVIKGLSSSARAQYNTGKSLVMFGSIFGIVGFILCIAGIVAPKKEFSEYRKSSNSSKSKRRRLLEECDVCGKKLLPTDVSNFNTDDKELKLCHNCFVERTKVPKIIKKETDKKHDDKDLIKILKTRYAKGEITKEEFEQMKKDIS